MSRTAALSIYVSDGVNAELKNTIVGVFENLAKKTVSGRLKSKNGEYNQKTGSLEFKRFANAERKAYGTAREAGAGTKVKAPPVVVNLDRNSEIVEEVNAFDGATFTNEDLQSFLKRRKTSHAMSVERDLDREFFLAGKNGGTKGADVSKSKKLKSELGAIAVQLESTKNDYVDGVDREQMAWVLSPALHQLVKDELNDCYNFSGTAEDEVIKGLDGIAVYSSNRLPEGVDYMLITMDAIAQPVMLSDALVEKIPLSHEFAVEIFWRNGTKVIAPELVIYGGVTA